MKLGDKPSDIDAAFNLLNTHSNIGGEEVDNEIYERMNNPKDSVGKVLNHIADVNERQFKLWQNNSKQREARYIEKQENYYRYNTDFSPSEIKDAVADDVKYFRNNSSDIKVYRGGGRKNAESWTTDSRGAHTGNGMRIRVDHKSSVAEMLKTHRIVGGISQMVGAPGEAEIFFVKRKR